MRNTGVEGLRLILDTSAYSHLRAGHPQVLDRVAAAEAVFLPIVVLGELEAAFLLGSRERENRRVLAEFLAEPFTAVLPVTLGVTRHYGQLIAGCAGPVPRSPSTTSGSPQRPATAAGTC